MIALIRDGIINTDGTWADLGAGSGNFTVALREIVGQEAIIHAIDHNARDLMRNQAANEHHQADFTRPLPVAELDGILMANALHWVRKQQTVLAHIKDALKPDGCLVVVEYDVTIPRPYMVPYPVPFKRLCALGEATGFTRIRQIGQRQSPRTGTTMIAVQLCLN